MPKEGAGWYLVTGGQGVGAASAAEEEAFCSHSQADAQGASPGTRTNSFLIHAAAAFPLLGLGQLVLGQAGAWAVKCQDNWCWAVPAESVLVLEQWHQCKDDWCWDSCHQAWLDSAGTDTAILSFRDRKSVV